jgi:hypothetical protein
MARAGLPTRLMAGLTLLKHMYDLSDEALCDCLQPLTDLSHRCGSRRDGLL